MKFSILSAYIFFLIFVDANAQELNAENIYSNINDAIVTIYTFDVNGKILSQGSGVVLNDKGWVVTNYHVFAGADKLAVKHKEKVVEYKRIVGLDVEKDILILEIDDKTFQSIKIGNSDSLRVGQKIYAIGSPMGFENTITEGIISGLRSYKEEAKNFIQISAAISPGSSGGAVVNAKGQLIAISTSTVTEAQNLNFAIPVNAVVKVYKKEGVKQNEIDASVFFNNGLNESKRKNYDIAILHYKKSLELNPMLYEAYNNLGIVFVKMGDFESAINNYKKAIAINSGYAPAYYNLGIAFGKKGDHETAISYFKKVIDIDPTYAGAYCNLGVAFGKKGDFESEISYYKKAITINPENDEAYYNLGIAYSEKEDFETAIIYLKKTIDINPSNIDAYCSLGVAFGKKGDFETAIIYLKNIVAITPDFAKAYYYLGLIYGMKGDENIAQNYLKKAFELDPNLRSKQ